MYYIDKALLRKRFIIENLFGVLKYSMNLEHSRHRSPLYAFGQLMPPLVPYSYKNKT